MKKSCRWPRFSMLSVVILLIAQVASGVSPEASASEAMIEKERRRLEELFIWKMSEELKLPVEIENPFSEAMRALNREKLKANVEVAAALNEISQAQSLEKSKIRGATEKAVKRYEKAWKNYGDLPRREVSRLKPILGSERLGRYLIAKSQMAEKMKALSASDTLETK